MKLISILCALLMSLPLAFAIDPLEKNNLTQQTAGPERAASEAEPAPVKSAFRKFMDGENLGHSFFSNYPSLDNLTLDEVSTLERLHDALYKRDLESENRYRSLETEVEGLPKDEEHKTQRTNRYRELITIYDSLAKNELLLAKALVLTIKNRDLHNFNFPEPFLAMFREGTDQKNVCTLFRDLLKTVPNGVATKDKWFKVVLNLLTNLPDNERNYETLSWFVTKYVKEVKDNPNKSAKTRLRTFRDATLAQQKIEPGYRLTRSDIENLFTQDPDGWNKAKSKIELLSRDAWGKACKAGDTAKTAGQMAVLTVQHPMLMLYGVLLSL